MSRRKTIVVISIAGVIITVFVALGIMAYESKKEKNPSSNQVDMNVVQKENTVINENIVTEIEKKERYSDTIVFNPKKQVSVRSISHEKYNRRNEISPAFM